ncbi:IS200/IS605 family transposase [Acetohalobium arabaticum]|uniref:Transposase IS200-family protein n=1 Tax=Acetohalobium arabaticum (strain ATCC 49924 / DSM 5501 / Z-7288) TaxID=574087 RepID=D9QSP2_ACEAZ|nr:IS200/IS605 family transposase [Acetohalobium arabaticum]ADL13505.1 transposase IS200-family protein [Acetohalobium arabaticum DSM 5501]
MNRQLNSNRHSVYSLKYHLVVITKYRHKCINSKIFDELEKIFTRLLNDKDCKVLEFAGEEDHIHVLFETPPQIQLSKLVNTLKTVSSRLIKKDYEEHLKDYYWESAFWSRSYCIISTGGKKSNDNIKKIINRYLKSIEK